MSPHRERPGPRLGFIHGGEEARAAAMNEKGTVGNGRRGNSVCRLTSTASVVAKWKGSLQTGRRAHESVQARERHVRTGRW